MDAHFCIQNNIKSSQIKSNFIYCRYKYYMSSVEQQGNIIFEWLFNWHKLSLQTCMHTFRNAIAMVKTFIASQNIKETWNKYKMAAHS